MNIQEIFETLDKIYQSGDSSKAGDYLSLRLSEAEADGDKAAIMIICNELGGFYRAVGRHSEGSLLYEKALSAIRDLELTGSENHMVTLINYGTNHAVSGNTEKAMEIFSQAAELLKKNGCTADYRLATLHNNMSILCQDTGDYEEALNHLLSALKILESLEESQIETAITYTNMAQIYYQMEDYKQSLKMAELSLNIFEENQGQTDVHYSSALETLGHIHLKSGCQAEALSFFKKALECTERDYGSDSAAYKALAQFMDHIE